MNEVNSLKSLKQNNKSTILRTLYENGGMSRLELSKSIGLTSASISVLIKDLMECGAVIETGSIQRNKSGRKEVIVEINYDELRVANVTIETDKIYFSICTRYETLVEKVFDSSLIETFEPIELGDDDILSAHFNEKYKIRCIGIGVIGKVDTDNGILIDSRGLFPPNYPLKRVLSMQYPYPIVITNNVRAQAYSIINSTLKDFFYVKHGPGLGGAIVSAGRIVRGNNNDAGEIGRTKVRNIKENITLGDYVAEKRIRKLYFEQTGNELEISEIYNRFNTCEVAKSILSECIKQLSETIHNTTFIIDPEKIVVSGGIFDNLVLYEYFLLLLRNAGCTKPVIRPENSERLKFLASGNFALKFCLFGLIQPDDEDGFSESTHHSCPPLADTIIDDI